MSAILLGYFAPNSAEWHAARAQGIGASEIAAVVGLSPFESPFSLWHRKAGNISGPDPSNPLFYWGHALEPLVADKFAELHPEYSVQKCGTYKHEDRPWQIGNLDRLLVNADVIAPLEIKTTRFGDNWGPTGSDLIPVHVRCQVMQQMDVWSAPYAYVAVLIGGNDYREYMIPFDRGDAAALREAGAAFWASIETDDEPPLDASWATYEAVRDLHPDINGEDVEVNAALYARYAATKADADSAADAHRQAKSELLTAMGEARRATVEGIPLLRRQPGRGGSVSLYPITPKDAA
jgi:putative phage-type endonuclease